MIAKFTWESFLDIQSTTPMTAIKLLRRVIRHQCYDYIYRHKLEQKRNFEFYHIEDEDLFLDLRLNYNNEREREI